MGRTRTRRGEGSGAAARRGLLAIAAVLALGCTGPVAKGPSAPDRFDDLAGATDGASSDNGVTIRQVQARRDTEPFSLTAIDGTRLALDRLEIRADLDEPLAFTEIELEFGNPEGRSLDAWLMVAIPKGARVTRFAVHDGGVWRDAEIVARGSCYRPLTVDGVPLIGPVPDVPGAYLATAHASWGICNAPATGRMVAEMVLDGASRSLDAAPFALSRLPMGRIAV